MIQPLRAEVLQMLIVHDICSNCDPETKAMPNGSKCILNVPFPLYNKSNNYLFIDNSKTFNN